jgi:hypothetical protein
MRRGCWQITGTSDVPCRRRVRRSGRSTSTTRTCWSQVAGQPGAITAGTLHPDLPVLTEPAQQLPVAAPVTEESSPLIQHGSMMGATRGCRPRR